MEYIMQKCGGFNPSGGMSPYICKVLNDTT